MTQESITIDEIIKLNNERTQGFWFIDHDWAAICTMVEPERQKNIARVNMHFRDQVRDEEFIAASPRIAAKAIELDTENKRLQNLLDDLNGNMESMEQTNQALLKRLGK